MNKYINDMKVTSVLCSNTLTVRKIVILVIKISSPLQAVCALGMESGKFQMSSSGCNFIIFMFFCYFCYLDEFALPLSKEAMLHQ